MSAPVAIDARAAVRREIGGVERVARELVTRLPAIHPGRYEVMAPRPALAHEAGHAWEQLALPSETTFGSLRDFGAAHVGSTTPIPIMRNAVMLGTKKYSPPRVSTNCGMPSTTNGGRPDFGSDAITNLAFGPSAPSSWLPVSGQASLPAFASRP